ncbi:HesA/MoeB/ThiF family protein [Bacillus sp. SG-1]|uniref:HesA/MoeB/ThiF family protein n=1 Tax=Bacillus sp. SG-1 TaxID=161544 RepID=UPI0001544FC2|nr:ThiF family adenylyltransferase [Bacillus sp. SG-1]EDL62876.1 molybdopterin biosynthesis protein (HesA/MoeB/ThiF family protein), putative [Bacillus sp. SG-1]
MKPKFKNSFTSIIEKENSVLLLLEDDCLEISDPDNEFISLINQLDGNQSLAEIALNLNSTEEDVLQIIIDLSEHGLVEDQSHSEQTHLSVQEKERYRSNLNYFNVFSNLQNSKYTFQEKLKNSTVTVLGLGGSNTVLSCLAGIGVGNIIGVDFDEIELSNLNRQFLYNEGNIGRLKTQIAKEELDKMNSNINVQVLNLQIKNANQLSAIVKNSDLIINSIDQPSILSTRWVNFAAVKHNIPLLQAGTGGRKLLLQRFMVNSGGCFDCYLIQILKNNPEFEDELRVIYGAKLEGRNTAFAPNVAFLAGLLSNEAANILCDFSHKENFSKTTEYSSLSLEKVASSEWHQVDNCPTCKNMVLTQEPVELDTLISIAKEEKRGLKI